MKKNRNAENRGSQGREQGFWTKLPNTHAKISFLNHGPFQIECLDESHFAAVKYGEMALIG